VSLLSLAILLMMMRAASWQVLTNLVVRLTLQMTWIALTATDVPEKPGNSGFSLCSSAI
jgi:hypothetical protein